MLFGHSAIYTFDLPQNFVKHEDIALHCHLNLECVKCILNVYLPPHPKPHSVERNKALSQDSLEFSGSHLTL